MTEIEGTWSEVAVAGHPCDVFEPARPSEHGYVVIYLHGVHLNRLVDNAPFGEQFARHGLRVICPMTRRSWWADRICEEFDPNISAAKHVTQNIVPFVAQRWGAQPPRIALLGTSMGGQGALRLSFWHPNMFPIVAAISPAIDYHLRMRDGDETLWQMYSDIEAARQDTATLHVHPLNWPRNIWFSCDPADHRWHDSADRLHMKLYSLGIPHDYDLETRAGGHSFDYYNHMAGKALEFIVERLERERLRVP
jgi:S-formylglutathione hydrolase FrmB